MSKSRLLASLILTAALLLSAGVALAQGDAEASMTPEEGAGGLQAMMPLEIAGLPVGENLQISTSEEVVALMTPEQTAVLDAMLTANGATYADHEVASIMLMPSDTEYIALGAHRIAGVLAAENMDAWVAILGAFAVEPATSTATLDGRPVTLLSDAAHEDAAPRYLFPAGEVVWLVLASDEAMVSAALDAVGAEGGGGAEE